MKGAPFGTYIRSRRVAAGLSLRDVAARIGVSHVYLGEVERGIRAALKVERWPDLVRVVPGITIEDLERQAALSRPVQLSLADAPAQYQDLALALARRIEEQDLPQKDLQVLLRMLRGPDE